MTHSRTLALMLVLLSLCGVASAESCAEESRAITRGSFSDEFAWGDAPVGFFFIHTGAINGVKYIEFRSVTDKNRAFYLYEPPEEAYYLYKSIEDAAYLKSRSAEKKP